MWSCHNLESCCHPEVVLNDDVKRWRLCRLPVSLSLSAATFLVVALLAIPALGQAGGDRKVITRVEPEYPETLKRLYIGGIVRVEALIASNGTVESAELIGGNPILGQTAMKAVKRWKYAQANAKEKLIVTFEFDPHK
jgi:TonB family protein